MGMAARTKSTDGGMVVVDEHSASPPWVIPVVRTVVLVAVRRHPVSHQPTTVVEGATRGEDRIRIVEDPSQGMIATEHGPWVWLGEEQRMANFVVLSVWRAS